MEGGFETLRPLRRSALMDGAAHVTHAVIIRPAVGPPPSPALSDSRVLQQPTNSTCFHTTQTCCQNHLIHATDTRLTQVHFRASRLSVHVPAQILITYTGDPTSSAAYTTPSLRMAHWPKSRFTRPSALGRMSCKRARSAASTRVHGRIGKPYVFKDSQRQAHGHTGVRRVLCRDSQYSAASPGLEGRTTIAPT